VRLRGELVELRTLDPADAPALGAIVRKPEVADWWGAMPKDFPLEDDPGTERLTILLDGDVVGLIQFAEEPDFDYRHAWLDIFLDPTFQGRGIAVDAFKTLVRYLFEERGHHRITTDPAPGNHAAIRLCEKVGFRGVGVMRAYWRDSPSGSWRDAFLMELVKEQVDAN